jgi:hypothetical protein
MGRDMWIRHTWVMSTTPGQGHSPCAGTLVSERRVPEHNAWLGTGDFDHSAGFRSITQGSGAHRMAWDT